jgi:hypothetical protein
MPHLLSSPLATSPLERTGGEAIEKNSLIFLSFGFLSPGEDGR